MRLHGTSVEAFKLFSKWMSDATPLRLDIVKHGALPEQFTGTLHFIDTPEKQIGFAVARTPEFLDIDLTAALFVVGSDFVEAERFKDRIVIRELVH